MEMRKELKVDHRVGLEPTTLGISHVQASLLETPFRAWQGQHLLRWICVLKYQENEKWSAADVLHILGTSIVHRHAVTLELARGVMRITTALASLFCFGTDRGQKPCKTAGHQSHTCHDNRRKDFKRTERLDKHRFLRGFGRRSVGSSFVARTRLSAVLLRGT